MKKIILYAAAATLLSCQHGTTASSETSTAISVVTDQTDSVTICPDANTILRAFDCPAHPESACLFRLASIKDVRLAPVVSCTLPASVGTEGGTFNTDPQARPKAIQGFYSAVRKSCAPFEQPIRSTHELANSECYIQIRNELIALAKCTYTKRALIVYSNCFEKSSIYNSYVENYEKPELIARAFMKAGALPDNLTGITVYFIFQPQSRLEDRRFQMMSQAYRTVLEARGAKAIVQATLDLTLNNTTE